MYNQASITEYREQLLARIRSGHCTPSEWQAYAWLSYELMNNVTKFRSSSSIFGTICFDVPAKYAVSVESLMRALCVELVSKKVMRRADDNAVVSVSLEYKTGEIGVVNMQA